MPTPATTPVTEADSLRDSARDLAHSTLQIDDPGAIYAITGSLSAALAATAQILHQLGATHDDAPGPGSPGSPPPATRSDQATAYRAAWELHRAGEMLAQVAAVVERAHQLEASVAYGVHLPVQIPVPISDPAPPRSEAGLSL